MPDSDGELLLGMFQLHTQVRSPRILPGGILGTHKEKERFELPREEEPPLVDVFDPPEDQEFIVRLFKSTTSTGSSRAVGVSIANLGVTQLGDINNDARYGTAVLDVQSRYVFLCGRQRASSSGTILDASRFLRVGDFIDPNNPVIVDERDWRTDMGLPDDRRWSVLGMVYDRHRDRVLLVASWTGSGSQQSLWYSTYDWTNKTQPVLVATAEVNIGTGTDLSSDMVLSPDGTHAFAYHAPPTGGGEPRFRSWRWHEDGSLELAATLNIPLVGSPNDNPSAEGLFPIAYDPVGKRVFAGRPVGGGLSGGTTMTGGLAEIDVSDPANLVLLQMHFVTDQALPSKYNFHVPLGGNRLYVHDFIEALTEHHDLVIYDCSVPGTLTELSRLQFPDALVSDRRSHTHSMQLIGLGTGLVRSLNNRVQTYRIVGDTIQFVGTNTFDDVGGQGMITMAFGSNANPWTPELG